MKISKLLSFLLGMSGFLRMGVMDGDGGGASEALDIHSAADAFGALMGGDEDDSQASTTDQAADDSPEAAAERLAKQELSGNEEGGDAPEAEKTFTVEIDGKQVQLTAAEIAENHKNGLRQADYTRKTMEAAEARKAAETEANQARQEREQYAQKLNHYAISTEAQLNAIAAELTQDLLDTDPVGYLTKQRTLQEGQAKLAQAQGELSKLTAQQQEERAAAETAYYADQQAKLLAKVPEWKDPKKQEADVAAMKEYLGTQEFTPEEQRFPDHRLVILARKAMQFDQLMERAKGAVKKVAALPVKVERAGAPDTGNSKKVEAFKRLSKTGSVDDAANAFSQIL